MFTLNLRVSNLWVFLNIAWLSRMSGFQPKNDWHSNISLQDPCCYPAVISDYDRDLNASAKPCTRWLNCKTGYRQPFQLHFFQESKASLHFSFPSTDRIWACLSLCIHPPSHYSACHCALAWLAPWQEDAVFPHHRTGGAQERTSARGDGGAEGEAVGEGEGWQGEIEVESLTQGGGGASVRRRSAPSDA